MKTKQRISLYFFIGFFLALIYAVPIAQAIAEHAKHSRIQALDIVEDVFITPFKNAQKKHTLAFEQTLLADSLFADVISASPGAPLATSDRASHAMLVADNALAVLGDLKTGCITVNRHVKLDSTALHFATIDTLISKWNAVLTLVRQDTILTAATELSAQIRQCSQQVLHDHNAPNILDIPRMCLKNLRYIFWNDHYLRPYEKELENSSVFASALRPQMQYLRYELFKDLGEKGVLGQNGWFFYKPDVDFLIKPSVRDPRSIVVDPNDKPTTDNPIKAICAFKEQLNKRSIDLLVVIIPGKPSIYPDCVSRKLSPAQSGAFSHSLRMIEDLQKQGVDAVDLFGPFARERRNDSLAGDSLYLRFDTHWRARGLRLAAHEVANRIKAYPWYQAGTTEFALDSVFVDRTGDVAVMTTLPLDKMHKKTASFTPEKTRCYQVYRVIRDSAGNQTDRILYKDDFKNSPILLLGDSFSRIYQTDEPRSAGWISHIALELSRPIASVVNDGGASTLVRESLARRPNLLKGKKLVVWEIVERDFRFGDEGWKDVPLVVNAP